MPSTHLVWVSHLNGLHACHAVRLQLGLSHTIMGPPSLKTQEIRVRLIPSNQAVSPTQVPPKAQMINKSACQKLPPPFNDKQGTIQLCCDAFPIQPMIKVVVFNISDCQFVSLITWNPAYMSMVNNVLYKKPPCI